MKTKLFSKGAHFVGKKTLSSALAVIVVFFFLGGIAFQRHFNLVFVPSLFINEIFKLILSLVSIAASFILGTVFWWMSSINRRTKRLQSFLVNSHAQIRDIIERVHKLLNEETYFQYRNFNSAEWQLVQLRSLMDKYDLLIPLLYDVDMTIPIWQVLVYYNQVGMLAQQLFFAIKDKDEDSIRTLEATLHRVINQSQPYFQGEDIS